MTYILYTYCVTQVLEVTHYTLYCEHGGKEDCEDLDLVDGVL